MYKKIISLIAFILLVLSAFIYFLFLNNPKDESTQTNQKEDTYEEWSNKQDEVLDSRLNFDKQLGFVFVGELNSGGLNYPVLADLAEDMVSYNNETKSAYFYNEEVAPKEWHNLLVVHNVNTYDVLLNQHVDYSGNSDYLLNFGSIRYDGFNDETTPINNKERLFLHERMNLEMNEKGELQVKFVGENIVIPPGKSKIFDRKEIVEGKELLSKIVVTNFGLWNTKNMKYVVSQN